MTNDSIIAEIDKNIKDAKPVVELAQALERLRKNRDFITVIGKGYFQDEAVRLVHLKAEPGFDTPVRQQSVLTQIDAIGHFHQYLNTVAYKGMTAQKSIDEGEEARAEVLAEETGANGNGGAV